MKETVDYQFLESIRLECLEWTFGLLDAFSLAEAKEGEPFQLEHAKEVFMKAMPQVLQRRERILLMSGQIDIHVKPMRNFLVALNKLLDSIVLRFLKIAKTKPLNFFDALEDNDLSKWKMEANMVKMKKQLEDNWVAFCQSYGRMLYKMKVNGYDIF